MASVSFTDYNALQPYFNQYRALAAQYGFQADQGDLLLASDPNFQRWVTTGALPIQPSVAQSTVLGASTGSPTITGGSGGGSAGGGGIPQAGPSGAVDYSLITLSGLGFAGPQGGPSTASEQATAVLTGPVLPPAGVPWKLLAIVAIALYVLRK